MRLSFLKEANADAMAAIAGQQHAFTEVEYPVRIVTRFDEGRLYLFGLCRHRHASRHADHFAVIERQHENRAVRIGIGREIVALIVQRAVIEIGKGAKYFDPQPREVVEIGAASMPERDLISTVMGIFTFGCTGYTVMENPRKH